MIIYLLSFKPIKKAILKNEMKEKEYVVVQIFYTTASTWGIIGDQNSNYDIPLAVTLTGNVPRLCYDIQIGGNTFICYGRYLDNIITLAGYENKVFEVDSWEILYPVNHNSIFSTILSKKYLYSFEFE